MGKPAGELTRELGSNGARVSLFPPVFITNLGLEKTVVQGLDLVDGGQQVIADGDSHEHSQTG